MTFINQLEDKDFKKLCWQITRGLGMNAKKFPVEGLDRHIFLRADLVRESSDGMFRTDEPWLCAFLRPPNPLNLEDIQPLINVIIAAQVRYFLGVVFNTITEEAADKLRQKLVQESVQVVLLTEALAETLVNDYGNISALKHQTSSGGFSFARLRKYAQSLVDDAPWRDYFQTTSIQPARLLPLHKGDKTLAEADLNRALREDSFLLLGEPGTGKTTSLLMLTHELARVGGRTPVFLPLGRYRGDFWDLLCEALAPENHPVTRDTAQALLHSGGLALLLDGINEVQDPDLQRQLVDDINRLTAPDSASARSRWIVSGRVHDYEQSRVSLRNLESRRWEMQPLSADLIYRLLADALGEAEGLALYQDMGQSVREICTNPLLLTMVLAVYRKTGQAPVGRGALYHRFINLLLYWGEERSIGTAERQSLISLLPNMQNYEELVLDALTALATTMPTTILQWRDAQRQFAHTLASASDPMQAARLLLQDLTRCGILRRDVFNRMRFYHHTFQEYFQARALHGKSAGELIPRSGVPAAQREAVLFAATMATDPTPLIQRALDVDLLLAYEIVRDTRNSVPESIERQVAANLWSRIRAKTSSRAVGGNRRWALLFRRMATLRGQNVETMAVEIDAGASQNTRTYRLMTFYRELGDVQAQQRVLTQAIEGDNVPDDLLFSAALASGDSKNHKRAVKLYTHHLEKHPNSASAYHNRGAAYRALGRKEEALADYRRAVGLEGNAVHLTNLAILLYDLDQKDEALVQIHQALKRDPKLSTTHSNLANWLENDEPETALRHREQAARYAMHDEDLRLYLRKLADLQEKLGHHARVIRSLRQLIALDPTSSSVRTWKNRIAKARQALDAEARTRSARERLQEQGELPLPTLTFEWLRAAGLDIENPTAIWFLTKGGRGLPERLPVVLVAEPHITGAGLRDVLDALPRSIRQSSHLLLVTAAETLSLEARHQLAALQDECTVALVTALEVRDALLLSDRECRLLLDRVLQRAGRTANPFTYKGVVREHTEFFGRVAELESLTTSIGSGQQVGLYGIHKIGKSSLLESLRRKLHLSYPEITVVKVELDAGLKEASDFYHLVLEHLPGARELPSASSLSARAFRHKLTKFHQQRQRERPNHRLLLMVDEYAYLIPDRNERGGLNDFISVLGLLKALYQEGWLLVLPCGRTASLNRQASWGEDENPFIDLLHAQFLGPLTREENDTLMTTLGVRAGLSFTKDALDTIYVETGGHPAFSRALGEQLAGSGASQITTSQVERVVNRLLADRDQQTILLGIYEKRLDQDEQRLARVIALDGPQPRKTLFPDDADITARRQIRDALANLVDTTVLVEQPDGRIAHRYGLLRRVIQKEMEDLGL